MPISTGRREAVPETPALTVVCFKGEEPWAQGTQISLLQRKTLSWSSRAGKHTCFLLWQETSSSPYKAIGYTKTFEKMTRKRHRQCLSSQDVQRCKTTINCLPTVNTQHSTIRRKNIGFSPVHICMYLDRYASVHSFTYLFIISNDSWFSIFFPQWKYPYSQTLTFLFSIKILKPSCFLLHYLVEGITQLNFWIV